MTLRTILGLLAVGLIGLSVGAGCKRKPKSDPPPLSAPLPSTATTPEEALAEIHRALELWTFKRSQPPKDLNELVTGGFLQRLPSPPAGKKFVLDVAKMRVQLVAE